MRERGHIPELARTRRTMKQEKRGCRRGGVGAGESLEAFDERRRLRWMTVIAEAEAMRKAEAKAVVKEMTMSETSDEGEDKARDDGEKQNAEAEDQKDGCGTAGSQVVAQMKAHRRKEEGWGRGCLALDEARRGGMYTQIETIRDRILYAQK